MNRLTNLQARILTAAVIGPVAIGAAWVGLITWTILVCVTMGAAAREWLRLVIGPDHGLAPCLALAVGLGTLTIVAASQALPVLALVTGLAAALIGGLVGWRVSAPRLSAFCLGLVYLGAPAVALVWLHRQPEIGLALIVWTLVVVWATDIGAYAVGRSVGGPKLWPAVSPRKTWAGFIGGLLFGTAAGLCVRYAAQSDLPVALIIIAPLVSAAAQAGDLLESAIKRRRGVKDTGGLLPGHGGVLDRLDGLFVAAPVFAAILAIVGDDLTWP